MDIKMILLIWNVLVFLLYGYDKYCAKHDKWRVPESTLLVCAFLMGAIGAWFGMRAFHHKTKHKKFTVLVPIFVVINAAAIVYLTGFY